jgi:hypothetical protein
VLHKQLEAWRYIYIYIYINPNTLLFLMYKKFLSLSANFHSPFHKTTMPTLSHLTYCTPTNSGLCFASSVFCVSKFNAPFSIAYIIPNNPLKSKLCSNIVQHSGFFVIEQQILIVTLFWLSTTAY